MNVTVLGARVCGGRAVFGTRDGTQARRQAGEDRIKALYSRGVAPIIMQ